MIIYISHEDWENLDGGKACKMAAEIKTIKKEMWPLEGLVVEGNANMSSINKLMQLGRRVSTLENEFERLYYHYSFEFHFTDDKEYLSYHSTEVMVHILAHSDH